jgi:hypothetical protein
MPSLLVWIAVPPPPNGKEGVMSAILVIFTQALIRVGPVAHMNAVCQGVGVFFDRNYRCSGSMKSLIKKGWSCDDH